MTALHVARRFAAAYWRQPVNIALLALVPLVFVTLSAGVLADFSRLLGVTGAGPGQLQAATAAWAVAFLVGIGSLSQALSSRAGDRRLALAGMQVRSLLAARLVTVLGISLVAVVAALGALAVRSPELISWRVLLVLALFAITYAGIGTAVGVLVREEFNASLAVLFVWMFDVFLGPGMNATESIATRVLPTHFTTLYLLDASSGHAGSVPDLIVALGWAAAAIAASAWAFHSRVAPSPPASRHRLVRAAGWLRSARGVTTAAILGRAYLRNVVMWPMLALVPVLFVWLAIKVTPVVQIPVRLVEDGDGAIRLLDMRDVHAAVMVPIAVAFLAAVAGIFVAADARHADRRLAMAGMPVRSIIGACAAIMLGMVLLVCAASIAGMTFDFTPRQYGPFIAANIMIGITYALLGVFAAGLIGRTGAFYAMFVLPFLDIGLAQNVMFAPVAPGWGAWMPARGAMEVVIDASFTDAFDRASMLALAAGWMGLAGLVAWIGYRRRGTSL